MTTTEDEMFKLWEDIILDYLRANRETFAQTLEVITELEVLLKVLNTQLSDFAHPELTVNTDPQTTETMFKLGTAVCIQLLINHIKEVRKTHGN